MSIRDENFSLVVSQDGYGLRIAEDVERGLIQVDIWKAELIHGRPSGRTKSVRTMIDAQGARDHLDMFRANIRRAMQSITQDERNAARIADIERRKALEFASSFKFTP